MQPDLKLQRQANRLQPFPSFAQIFVVFVLHGQTTTLRTTFPLRVVPVSVEDGERRPVSGLKSSDFVLFDNGQPRPATVDVSNVSAAPVAMVVLVQTSDFAYNVLSKIGR